MSPSRQLFDALTTAILVFDEQQVCRYANESSQVLLCVGKQGLVGVTCADLFRANRDILLHCTAVLACSKPIVLREIQIHLPQWRRSIWVDLLLTPYDLSSSAGLLVELIDRDAAKKLTQDAHTMAKFQATTKILRGLCHEIKNPLGGIKGAAQLLSMEVGDSEQEYTSVITREVDRLSALLDKMSSSHKSENFIKLDIHELITHALSIVRAQYVDKVKFQLDLDTSLPPIEVYSDSLQQAFLNLFLNAAQWATLAHETDNYYAQVYIKTRVANPDLMRSLMPQRGIQIQICDSGPGVDEDVKEQLFLPMVSRREEGSGLGLSLSQEIAISHGGFIELFDSSHLQGACFSMFLPLERLA